MLFCRKRRPDLLREPQGCGRQAGGLLEESLEPRATSTFTAEVNVTVGDGLFHLLLVIDPAPALRRPMLRPVGPSDGVKLVRCRVPGLHIRGNGLPRSTRIVVGILIPAEKLRRRRQLI